MTYGFNLEWEDLSEALRDDKITEYFEYQHKNSDCDTEDCNDVEKHDTPEGRESANEDIAAHFPIYF